MDFFNFKQIGLFFYENWFVFHYISLEITFYVLVCHYRLQCCTPNSNNYLKNLTCLPFFYRSARAVRPIDVIYIFLTFAQHKIYPLQCANGVVNFNSFSLRLYILLNIYRFCVIKNVTHSMSWWVTVYK